MHADGISALENDTSQTQRLTPSDSVRLLSSFARLLLRRYSRAAAVGRSMDAVTLSTVCHRDARRFVADRDVPGFLRWPPAADRTLASGEDAPKTTRSLALLVHVSLVIGYFRASMPPKRSRPTRIPIDIGIASMAANVRLLFARLAGHGGRLTSCGMRILRRLSLWAGREANFGSYRPKDLFSSLQVQADAGTEEKRR